MRAILVSPRVFSNGMGSGVTGVLVAGSDWWGFRIWQGGITKLFLLIRALLAEPGTGQDTCQLYLMDYLGPLTTNIYYYLRPSRLHSSNALCIRVFEQQLERQA